MTPAPIKRLGPLFKIRRRAPASGASPAAVAVPAGQPPAATADTAALQARRDELARRYAELQFDLGGLAYEMAIRDAFRLEVIVRRAAELQAVDSELGSVERLLGLAGPTATASCPSCRAPVELGARYCGRCGSVLARADGAAR